jgi:hypothetical protein
METLGIYPQGDAIEEYNGGIIEVSPVKDDGEFVSVCNPEEATYWSVYLPQKKGGVQCIADFPNEDHAIDFSNLIDRIWKMKEPEKKEVKKTLKRFPNGFRFWMETHHEVVSFITARATPNATGLLKEVQESHGMCGFYNLAEEWTDEFEKLYKGKYWDGEFFEEVEKFCQQKLGAL